MLPVSVSTSPERAWKIRLPRRVCLGGHADMWSIPPFFRLDSVAPIDDNLLESWFVIFEYRPTMPSRCGTAVAHLGM